MGQIRPFSVLTTAAAGWGVIALCVLQPSARGETSPYGATSVLTNPVRETAEFGPNFLGLQFVNEVYRDTVSLNGARQTSYPSLLIHGRAEKEWGSFGMYGEGQAYATINNAENRYLNVTEAYVGSSKAVTEGVRLHGGRKIEDWSSIDEYWKMGIWQPRFRWNYIEPETVGLTGLFLSQKFETFSYVAFASPVYLPEFGAAITENDGKLESTHPFFTPPPTTMQVFGQTTPLRYDLQIPPLMKIGLSPGASFMARVGRDSGWWGKFGYGYKPLNQIIMAYEGYLYLPTNQVQVNVYPRVVYHHIANAEVGYKSRRFETWAALMGELPNDSTLPTGRTTQVVSRGVMGSATVGYNFWGEGETSTGVSASVLQTMGGVKDDSGPLAAPGQQIFESRYSYRTAVAARGRVSVYRSELQKLSIVGRALYDFSVFGTILSSEVRYNLNRKWLFTLGADIMGAARSRAPVTGGGADFLGYYRANDRIRGGIGYVF